MSPLEVDTVKAAMDKVLNLIDLKKKGVGIINLDYFANNTGLPDALFEIVNSKFATSREKNAFFSNKANIILINKNKLPTAFFHEMGYAFNYNCSKFWKGMQKLRVPAMAIATALGIFVAVSKKSKPKTKMQSLQRDKKLKTE